MAIIAHDRLWLGTTIPSCMARNIFELPRSFVGIHNTVILRFEFNIIWCAFIYFQITPTEATTASLYDACLGKTGWLSGGRMLAKKDGLEIFPCEDPPPKKIYFRKCEFYLYVGLFLFITMMMKGYRSTICAFLHKSLWELICLK